MEPKADFIQRVEEVENFLSQKRGLFALFALLEREDTPERWDVLVAAPWLSTDRGGILTVAEQLTSRLTQDQIVQIARIVPLTPESDFVLFLQGVYKEMSVTGGRVRLGASVLSDIEIRSGYILAANASLNRAERLVAVPA